LPKLAFAPLSSYPLLSRSQSDISILKATVQRYVPNRVLQKLILCTTASISNLDLSTLFSMLSRHSSSSTESIIDLVESVDCFVGESPNTCPSEVKERAKHKIAPLTHTSPTSIVFHPVELLCTPVSREYVQFLVDESVLNLGVSGSNLTPSTGPVHPLSRPSPCANRVELKCKFDSLPKQVKEKYEVLARTLSAFGQEMGVRLEAWSLGPASQLAAQQLAQLVNMPDTSASGEKVSLIIVDRNLDLLPPSSFASYSLLDRLISKQHLSNLVDDRSKTDTSDSNVAHDLWPESPLETTFTATDPSEHDHVVSSLFHPPKDALAQLMRKLSEFALEEQIEVDFSVPGVEGARSALLALFTALNSSVSGRNRIYKHRSLLSAVEMVCDMQDEVMGRTRPHTTLFSTVKHILSSPGDSNMHYIKDYLQDCRDIPISAALRSVMTLTMLASFISPRKPISSDSKKEKEDAEKRRMVEEEDKSCLESIKTLLAERLNLDPLSPSLEPHWLNGVDYNDLVQVMGRLEAMFAYLCSESEIEFEDFHTFSERPKEPCLLAQLVSRVFDPSHPELRDVKLSSLSIGGILKSGLSFVNLRHQQRPNDRNTVIIYVLGGITMQEVYQTTQMFKKQNSNCQLLLASSHILSSWNLPDMYCS